MNWNAKTIAVAVAASICGLLFALALREMSIWPSWDYSEVLFGGLCGATAVHSIHRQRPLVVLVVFVPVMAALLLVVAVLFDVYVLGHPIDL